MTTADTKRIERIARESSELARKSLRKSNEIEAYLSVVGYRAGKIRRHSPCPTFSANSSWHEGDFHDRQI
jgi:hypothetical protein